MFLLEEHGCTHGFMSVERMSAVLGHYGREDLEENFKDMSVQVLVPGMNFSCSGRVVAWVFAAHWVGESDSLTELQIWRPREDGSFAKVGNTTITTEEDESQLYRYPLSLPLVFQAGDVLGFHQGAHSHTQLRLLYEDTVSGPQAYHTEQDTPLTTIRIENGSSVSTNFHVLIGIETGTYVYHELLSTAPVC